MATYEVSDGNMTVEFEWSGSSAPTQQDVHKIITDAKTSRGTTNPAISPMANPKGTTISAEDSTAYVPDWGIRNPNLYGLYGAGRELYRQAGKPAIEGLGMLLGGMAGAGSPVPGGTMIGAGLGYGMGKNLTGLADRWLELEKPTPQTLYNRAAETGKDVLTGAAFEGGGQVIGKGLGWIGDTFLSPFARRMANLDNSTVYGISKDINLPLLPSEANMSKDLALFENILRSSPASADIFGDWMRKNQFSRLEALRDSLISKRQGADVLSAGQEIKEGVADYLKRENAGKEIYLEKLRNAVNQRMGSDLTTEELVTNLQNNLAAQRNTAINLKNDKFSGIDADPSSASNLYSIANKLYGELSKRPVQDSGLMSVLKWATKREASPELTSAVDNLSQGGYPRNLQLSILEQSGVIPRGTTSDALDAMLSGEPIKRDWATLQGFRTDINRKINDATDATTRSYYGQLKNALDRDLEAIAGRSGTEASEKLKEANRYFREEYAPVWKSPVVQRIMDKPAAQGLDAIYKPNNSADLDVLKTAVGENEFGKTIKAGFVKRILGEGKGEAFDPSYMQKQIRYLGDNTLNTIFTPNEVSWLKSVAQHGRVSMGEKVMDANLLRGIAEGNPAFIVKSIIGETGALTKSLPLAKNIATLKRILPEESMDKITNEFVDRMFSFEFKTGAIRAEKLANITNKYGDTIKQFMSPEEAAWLRDVGMVAKRMSNAENMAANPSGTAQNLISFQTMGAILRNPVSGLMTAITPAIFARIYLSPLGRKWFMEGIKTPSNSPAASEIATKMMGIISTQPTYEHRITK